MYIYIYIYIYTYKYINEETIIEFGSIEIRKQKFNIKVLFQ